MRRCARSEELRAALAAEEQLAASLAAHVTTCSECAGICAAARRFGTRLETEMAELVTDALPSSTLVIARTAPVISRRRPSWRAVLSAFAAATFVAFAVLGVVITGASISDAIRGGLGTGSDPSDGEQETINCHLGDSTVDVVVDRSGDAAADVAIAYCIGTEQEAPAGGHAVTCVRSVDAAGHLHQPTSAGVPGVDSDADAYLDACTRVEDATAEDPPSEAGALLMVPSAPFGSWDEATEAVAWPVLRPAWLPDGYELAALQGFGASTDPEAIDSVVATYLRNGVPLSIDQFAIASPDAFRIELTIPGDDLVEVSTGRTTVGGHPAFWADGVVVQTSNGPGLDVDTLLLTWSHDQVGYRITARTEDLVALRRIAESLVDG